MNLGLKYHMNNIGIGLGYEMIKSGDHSSLNSFTIGLSYAFGGQSTDEKE
jgi:predicted porin